MKIRTIAMAFIATLIIIVPLHVHAKPLRIAVLSDIHYAVDGRDKGMKMLASGKELLPGILQEIDGRSDIDVMVFAGDIFVDPYYPELSEFMGVARANLTKPWYVIPGNHDRSMDKHKEQKVFTLEEFVNAFTGHPYSKGGKPYWSVDVDGYHLVGLDTTRADTWGGGISKEQMAWLASDLKKNRKKFTVIFAHHTIVEFYPELDLRKQFFVENQGDVLDLLLANPQVKLVASGHYHFPAAVLRDGVHHFSMPSTITYPSEYAVLTLDGDRVTFKTVPVGDEAYRRKAKQGLATQEDWRKRFTSDEHMIGLFRGIDAYSFTPRAH